MAVSDRIREARALSGLSMRQLAEKMTEAGNLAHATQVHRWETATGDPDPEQLVALSRALDKPVEWLLQDLIDRDATPATDAA